MICQRYFAATAARLAMIATTSSSLTACSNHESTANSIQMTTRATTTCMARSYLLHPLSPVHLSRGVSRSGRTSTTALHAGGAQAAEAFVLERLPPGEELLFRHLIAPIRLLECDDAVGHRRHDRGFAARHPPPGVRGWQLDHGRNL